jgi:uncharacterized protein
MKDKVIIMLSLVIIVLFIGLAAFIYNFFIHPQNPPLKKSTVIIGEHEFIVEIADNMVTRAKGLSGREGLGENEGMFFIFSSSSYQGFWMKDMNFSIDIVWISENKVVGFAESVPPEQTRILTGLKIYYPPEPVDKVLEINGGLVSKYNIKSGDIVEFQR